MPAIKFICFAALTLFAASASSQSSDYFAEGPLEALVQASAEGRVLQVEDFVRKNKGINIKDVFNLCRLPNQFDKYSRVEETFKRFVADNQLDFYYMINHGFVNLVCGDNIHFIIDAMFRDTVIFKKWVALGFDLNRPVVYKDLVGTPLDIAKYMLKRVSEDQKGLWRINIRYLMQHQFQTCKQQAIKCSIDFQ